MKNVNIESVKKRNKISYLIISFTLGISTLCDLAIQYFLKDELHLEPYEMSRVLAFIMIPWSLKPLLGLMTDLVPICGYRRKIYCLGSGLLAAVCWVYMSLYAATYYPTVIAFYFISFSFCFASIIGEAIIVELSKIKDDSGSKKNEEDAKNYVSLFFVFKNAGVLLASFFRGYLIQIMSLRNIFMLNAVIPLFVFVAGLILVEKSTKKRVNFEGETDVESDSKDLKETLLKDDKNINRDKNIEENEIDKMKLMEDFYVFIKRKESLVPAFLAVMLVSSPSCSDPFFYYMTNFLGFTPIQLGVLSFITSFGVFIAIISYRTFFQSWSFTKLTLSMTLLFFICTFALYLLILRVNIYFGISDFFTCCVSFLFVASVGELSLMPILTLAAQICPPKLEATVYSFFMAAINLGLTLSTLFSSFLTSYMGITNNNFDNLGNVFIIANLYKLIPCAMLVYIDKSYFERHFKKEEKNELLTEEEMLNAVDKNQNITKTII